MGIWNREAVAAAQDYPYPISPVCHSSHPQRACAKFLQAQFTTAHNVPGAKSGHIKHLFYQQKIPHWWTQLTWWRGW